jgi:hypothetical protein
VIVDDATLEVNAVVAAESGRPFFAASERGPVAQAAALGDAVAHALVGLAGGLLAPGGSAR